MNVTKYRVFVKAGLHAVYSNTWSSKDEMFYEVANIDYYDKEITVWGCHNKDCGMCDDTYKMEDVIIMPYIGLKDSNGRDIYEGDIVKDYKNALYTVEYSQEYCGYFRYPVNHLGNFMALCQGIQLEVMGNVYENPELLGV